jgi:hypothetical protein
MIALRHTDPGDPESGIAISTDLVTTSLRYKSDMHAFRRILQSIHFTRNGPLW